MELLLVLPLYLGIFVIYFRFQSIIKAMTEANDILSDLISKAENPAAQSDINKRDFLLKKIKNGESISSSKTPWTVERLEKASDKVVDKLFDKYQNPPVTCGSAKSINKKEALEVGTPICPVVIEMYAEALKILVDQMPYIKGRYIINSEKLKRSISKNKLFCDNLAIKIGSKVIEQMGENSVTHVGVSLAAMTWDAVERVVPPDCLAAQQDPVGHNVQQPRGDFLTVDNK